MITLLLLLSELGAAPSPPRPTSAPSVVASVATGTQRPKVALGAEQSPLLGKLWVASALLLGGAAVADAITSRGQYELNPVLGRGQFGRRQVGIKIALTGGSIGAQAFGVRRWPWMRRVFVVANVATAGALAGVAARNERRR
jgi:hypothetical protein